MLCSLLSMEKMMISPDLSPPWMPLKNKSLHSPSIGLTGKVPLIQCVIPLMFIESNNWEVFLTYMGELHSCCRLQSDGESVCLSISVHPAHCSPNPCPAHKACIWWIYRATIIISPEIQPVPQPVCYAVWTQHSTRGIRLSDLGTFLHYPKSTAKSAVWVKHTV